MTKALRVVLMTGLWAGSLWATSHCYLQRNHCFDVSDGKERVQMYTKRHTFADAGRRFGISKNEIESLIRAAEGDEAANERQDLRDSGGYYGGVYWPVPVYAYPYHHHRPHHNRPDKPHKPLRPDGPVTIQPTQNPAFNRPRPIQRPVQRPARPIQRPRSVPRTMRRG